MPKAVYPITKNKPEPEWKAGAKEENEPGWVIPLLQLYFSGSAFRIKSTLAMILLLESESGAEWLMFYSLITKVFPVYFPCFRSTTLKCWKKSFDVIIATQITYIFIFFFHLIIQIWLLTGKKIYPLQLWSIFSCDQVHTSDRRDVHFEVFLNQLFYWRLRASYFSFQYVTSCSFWTILA